MHDIIRKWTYSWSEPVFAPIAASMMLVLSTSRMAYALLSILSVAWTFFVTTAILYCIKKLLPRFGCGIIVVLCSGLVSSIFYLIVYFANPILAVKCSLMIVFTPAIYCIFALRNGNLHGELLQITGLTLKPALSVSIMIFFLALIREPLGYANLSIPGGKAGIIELFDADRIFPFSVQIINTPAGSLIILGLLLGLFRFINHDRDTGIHPEIKTEKSEEYKIKSEDKKDKIKSDDKKEAKE